MTERATTRVAKRVRLRLEAAESGSVSWSECRKMIAARDRAHFEDAIDHLRAAGVVAIETVESGQIIRVIEK